MKKIEKEFEFIGCIIDRHWNRAIGLANAESLMTYWTIGAFVSLRLKSAEWGAKTVEALCDYLKTRKPALKGYGRRNIYNMVAFYESYSSVEFNSVSERLRLDEFVQMPSAQIEQGAIVQPLSAQICESGVPRPFPDHRQQGTLSYRRVAQRSRQKVFWVYRTGQIQHSGHSREDLTAFPKRTRNRVEELFPLSDSCFCIQKSRIR